MKRAIGVRPGGTWTEAADEIVLDYDRRHRRRLRFVTASRCEVLLDLKEAVHLRDGDALVLEDGGLVAVRAAAEQLLEVTAPDAATLVRLAWHLGNRHLAVEFTASGRLRILDDHVIAAMVRGLGGSVQKLSAPFDPESGAYGHH